MKHIQINEHNRFDERAREFFSSKRSERLAQKYREKSYEERFGILYWISVIVSYLANGISIITASSFVFSYVYSILHSVPYPALWSAIFSGLVLVTIEVLQRILAPQFFKDWLQYGAKKLGLAVLALSSISILLSYLGSPDFISIVSNAPVYEAPKEMDITSIKTDYDTQIKEAKAEAEAYRFSKLYMNRLSDKHARVYKEMLGRVSDLRLAKNDKVNEAQQRNDSMLSESKEAFKEKELEYEATLSSKGSGLGMLAIIAQILFYVAIWFTEYFDFRVALQYAGYRRIKSDQQYIEDILEEESKKKTNDHLTLGKGLMDNDTAFRDIYTIEHTSFKDGSSKRYNAQQLDGIISTYQKRLEKAELDLDEDKILSLQQRLGYWGGLKQQLEQKVHQQLQ